MHQFLIALYLKMGNTTLARKWCDNLEDIKRKNNIALSDQSLSLIQQVRAGQTDPESIYKGIFGKSLGKKPQEGITFHVPPAARNGFKDNWEVPITRFFGRQQEITGIHSAFIGTQPVKLSHPFPDFRFASRLVTLTGIGGIGKSSLAWEAGTQLKPALSDRVVFISLSKITEASSIWNLLAVAIGLEQVSERPLLEDINVKLGEQPILLVFDGAEHLLQRDKQVQGMKAEITGLLTRLPNVACLITSRQKLGISGEREIVVLSLDKPADDTHQTLEQLHDIESVQLFVDRAEAARSDFILDQVNVKSVVAICNRLEGIPLAIVLAAANVKALLPSQILRILKRERFDARISTLSSDEEPHRSMYAALYSSYVLLPTDMQRFFAHLSVFRGGCSSQAAAHVCDEPLADEYLAVLRDRSLIVFHNTEFAGEDTDDGFRYSMLDTLRDFGARQLTVEERDLVSKRHCDYFRQVWENDAREGKQWHSWVRDEYENFCAALDWCLDNPQSADVGIQIASRLGPYWMEQGRYSEGRKWLEKIISVSHGGPDRERANATFWAGNLAAVQGDFDTAITYLGQARRLFTEPKDRIFLAAVLNGLGNAWQGKNALQSGRSCFEESIAIYRDAHIPLAVAQGLNNLGNVALDQGDLEASGQSHSESLAIRLNERKNQERQDPYGALERDIAQSILGLGRVAFARGDHKLARSSYEESFLKSEAVGDLRSMAIARHNQGVLAYAEENDDEARRHFKESLRWRRQLGDKAGIASTLYYLGLLDFFASDLAAAIPSLTESLETAWKIGDQATCTQALKAISYLGAVQGQMTWAAMLWRAAEQIRGNMALWKPMMPREQIKDKQMEFALRTFLGPERLIEAISGGKSQVPDQLILDVVSEANVLLYKTPEANTSGDKN